MTRPHEQGKENEPGIYRAMLCQSERAVTVRSDGISSEPGDGALVVVFFDPSKTADLSRRQKSFLLV